MPIEEFKERKSQKSEPHARVDSNLTTKESKKRKYKDDNGIDDPGVERTVKSERKEKKRRKQEVVAKITEIPGGQDGEDNDNVEGGKRAAKSETKKLKLKATVNMNDVQEDKAGQDREGDNNIEEKGKAEHVTTKPVKNKKKQKGEATSNTEISRDKTSKAKDGKEVVDLDIPQKKKRKNKTGFVDPNEDAALSDQARKSLAYAFSQFHRPNKWKFNKARQNWIIRNMWSSETIPEMYFPLVMAYLAKVQGGVRENLIQLCQAFLPLKPEIQPVDTLQLAEAAQPSSEINPPLPIDTVKLARAKAMSQALNLAGPLE